MIAGEASSVAEAVDLIERLHPDLILLDVQLGGETGFELLDRTRISSDVIFVTAYDEQSLPALQDKNGPILVKPVNPKRLQKILEPYMRRSGLADL
jgi:two-component system LytT family response regulator